MLLRRLNAEGIAMFKKYLVALKNNSSEAPPFELLTDSEYSEEILPPVEIEQQTFASRYEAAAYLSLTLDELENSHDVLRDAGLWVWLTLFYFDQACPLTAAGVREPKALERLIPNIGNYQRYYRHLFAGPYRVYRAHRDMPERTLALLCSPVHISGDVFEQFAAYQGIVTAPGAIEAITTLYYNPTTATLKRGAATKKPGSARRLVDFLNQIDLTWDLYSIRAGQLLDLLPREFQKYRA